MFLTAPVSFDDSVGWYTTDESYQLMCRTHQLLIGKCSLASYFGVSNLLRTLVLPVDAASWCFALSLLKTFRWFSLFCFQGTAMIATVGDIILVNPWKCYIVCLIIEQMLYWPQIWCSKVHCLVTKLKCPLFLMLDIHKDSCVLSQKTVTYCCHKKGGKWFVSISPFWGQYC